MFRYVIYSECFLMLQINFVQNTKVVEISIRFADGGI